MAKLKIITGENNPILRKRSAEVKKFDAALKKFAKDLKDLMLEADGLGLAAPQVANNIRIFVMTLNFGTKNAMVMPVINPVISSHGAETELKEEGCLSLPGIWADVPRWKEIVLEFNDLEGEKRVLKLIGLNARVAQHELDHLDGVLFIDRMVKKEKTGGMVF